MYKDMKKRKEKEKEIAVGGRRSVGTEKEDGGRQKNAEVAGWGVGGGWGLVAGLAGTGGEGAKGGGGGALLQRLSR